VAAVIPVEEEVPAVESIPAVGHGTVLNVELGAVGFRVGSVAIGLRPPAPSSVEPSGTPRRPTAVEPIPDGDEAEDAGLPIELPVVTGHVPDAVPAMPAPSNTDVDPEVPAAEVPVPSDVPAIELPIPEDVPGAEFSTPKDACGTEPPMPPQVELIPNAGFIGDTPDVSGLTPRDCISVAPSGMRTGGTGAPRPMPSGDVVPSGGSTGVVCAKAEVQPRRSAVKAEIQMCVIALPFLAKLRYRPCSLRLKLGPLRRTFHCTNIRRIYLIGLKHLYCGFLLILALDLSSARRTGSERPPSRNR
jgi:hypothetical protein